jgi:hypothetical protein
MSKQLRYMGEFLSRNSVVWRVEILQDGYSGNVGQLTFEADEALVINWKRTDKENVICGSEATIKIESPGDRTYEDLYTIKVGRIRMDVYRNNALYWSGTLDPEFYEEPYEKARYYVVELTFSDFGILDRLKYNLLGMQTLQAIITDALTRSNINYDSLDAETYCTTCFEGSNTKATPAALAVRSENFYDEDSKPSTLKEVLEGVLQPLALRMIQRNGKIFVYDMNGLYNLAPSRAIIWDGDSQTMGVDKVANNVTINFSPYSSAEVLSGELEFGGEYSVEMVNLVADPGASYYSYYPDYNPDWVNGTWGNDAVNFTIFISSQGSGLAYLNPLARYCHILPLVGGPSECDGIAWSFYSGGHGSIDEYHHWPKQILNGVTQESRTVIMKSNKVFLPALSEEGKKLYYIRLSLEMLLDARYNPFTDGSNEYNEGDHYDRMKTRTGFAFVPVAVNMYDNEGNAICHYVNSHIAKSAKKGRLVYCTGKWEPGAAVFGDAYLEYYDPSDLWESAGILGWKKNRQCFGRPGKGSAQSEVIIYDTFKQMADGEYIPYPTQGGYLEVTIYAGVQCFDMDEVVRGILIPQQTPWNSPRYWVDDNRYNQVRWLLYKAPKVELVKNNLVFDAAELDDVEYSGYINKHAKEEISIDTICGTANKICPTAKGIYCRASDSLQIQQLKRAGVTDHPEKLLIGTLYSQFAERKTTLSGEAVIDAGDICKYTEQNQPGKVFIMSGELQNVIMDTSEVEITEFNGDEYEAQDE